MSNKLSLEQIFQFQNRLALAGWVILIALPFWEFGRTFIVGLIIAILCASYVYLLIFATRHDDPANPKPKGSFFSLQGVVSLFRSPSAVITGWVHYLAFDLFVGFFIVNDAARYDISHWMLIPVLLATLMLGPSGLLLYLPMRAFYVDGWFDLSF